MITQVLNEMIGPGGRAILKFYFDNQGIINSIFLIWAIFMTYGSYKLSNIRHLTVRMAVEALKRNPSASNEQIFNEFLPNWKIAVDNLHVRYILNRTNLWVTKPTHEKLIDILRLSPEFFEAIRNGEVLKYRFAIPGKNDKLSSFNK
jgi:hypothetical protein